jgi:hypothetical protein
MYTINSATKQASQPPSPGEFCGPTPHHQIRFSAVQNVSGAGSATCRLLPTIRPPKSDPDTVPGRPAECRDDYPAVVIYLSDKRRVIECRDGLQWIVQRRRSVCPNSWRGVSYCRRKEGLLGCAGSADARAMERLHALPDRFPEDVRRACDQERPRCPENGRSRDT